MSRHVRSSISSPDELLFDNAIDRPTDPRATRLNNNKSAQSNLGRGPRRCESLPRGGLMTTAKVVAGEFITPHQFLRTLWAEPAHIAKAKARRSPVLKIDVVASVAA